MIATDRQHPHRADVVFVVLSLHDDLAPPALGFETWLATMSGFDFRGEAALQATTAGSSAATVTAVRQRKVKEHV